MILLIGILVCVGGLIGVIFNKPLARSMLKYHPESKHEKMFIVGRIAYVIIGVWMMIISLWALFQRT